MPAPLKSMPIGGRLRLPVGNGCLQLGTWRGIYLRAHRLNGGARQMVLTLQEQRQR